MLNDTDVRFMHIAIQQAKLCRPEDGRQHPFVGATVVREGTLLASGFRGELAPGEHAEYTVLEKKLATQAVSGATMYTTLEPCTTRNHPKVPCAHRLIERKVSRVVIGMLDPNQVITGRGIRRMREANIAVDLFPPDLMSEAEELNREFTRAQEGRALTGTVVRGLQEITELFQDLCLRAEKHIRLFIHALGADYKIPEDVARKIAAEIGRREKEDRPLRFHPVLVVDRSIPEQDFRDAFQKRLKIYAEHGVYDYIRPLLLATDTPVGIDVLLIDQRYALFTVTTASKSQKTQIGIFIEQHPQLLAELVDWFEHTVATRAESMTLGTTLT